VRACTCVPLRCTRYCLEPFRKVVNGDKKVLIAIRGGRQARQDVDGDEVHWCTGGDLAKLAMRSNRRPPAYGTSFTLSAPGINVFPHARPVVKAT